MWADEMNDKQGGYLEIHLIILQKLIIKLPLPFDLPTYNIPKY
jgi:hypothetical protein